MIWLYKLFPFLAPKFAGYKVGDEVMINSPHFRLKTIGMIINIHHYRTDKSDRYPFLIQFKSERTEKDSDKFELTEIRKLTKLERTLR